MEQADKQKRRQVWKPPGQKVPRASIQLGIVFFIKEIW